MYGDVNVLLYVGQRTQTNSYKNERTWKKSGQMSKVFELLSWLGGGGGDSLPYHALTWSINWEYVQHKTEIRVNQNKAQIRRHYAIKN